MKPSLAQTIEFLRQHRGLWVTRASLAAVGGARFGGRIQEARRLGYTIDTRYNGPASQYRLVSEPEGPRYQQLGCACGWRGDELSALGWHCPRCGRSVERAEVGQVALVLI